MTTNERRAGASMPVVAMLVSALCAAACTPTLDWRESRPDGGVTMMFPCRPEHHERSVRLGTTTVRMRLHSCSAGAAAFALAAVDVADPASVTPLLEALRGQAVANVGGAVTSHATPAIPGATPNVQSGRLRVVGRRPDGRGVVEHAAFFVKGLTLYQATVIGAEEAGGQETLDTFFGAIRLP